MLPVSLLLCCDLMGVLLAGASNPSRPMTVLLPRMGAVLPGVLCIRWGDGRVTPFSLVVDPVSVVGQ